MRPASLTPPLQTVAAVFNGDDHQLLQVTVLLRFSRVPRIRFTRVCVQWFDSKGLDMEGAENSLALPKLGRQGAVGWLQVRDSSWVAAVLCFTRDTLHIT